MTASTQRQPALQPASRLVVVGNGMASVAVIEELCAQSGGRHRITVIGDEPHGGYNRILLSSVLAGDKGLPDIVTHPPDWYVERGIDLRLGDPVTAIDRRRRVLLTRDGFETPWDHLILATGAQPVLPPIPGMDLAGVCGFRSIADVRTMLAAAEKGGRAVVIGGGILGLEAAWGLKRQGMTVSVVHMMDCLMERQLDSQAAGLLRRDLEGRGITFITGSQAAGIEGNGKAASVRLADGRRIEADLVVVAVGIRPNARLAEDAGLAVGRGILVGGDMRTSDPSIFAVGECVEHAGQCYGLVMPVRDMARVCAHHLADGEAERLFVPPDLSAKLKIPGIDLFSAGLTEPANDDDHELVYLAPDESVYKKLVLRDGRIVGAMLYGDVRDSAQLWQWMVDGADVSHLCPKDCGHACSCRGWIDLSGGLDAAALPDEAMVCHCNGVTKGAILAAVRQDGLTSLEQVCAKTRAGTGCGQCAALTAAVLAHALGPDAAGRLAADRDRALRRSRSMGFGFRWWHRVNAVLMALLLITGLALHFPRLLPLSFEWGYKLHKWSGLGVGGFYLLFLGLTIVFRRRWRLNVDGVTMFLLMPLMLLTGLIFLWPGLLPDRLWGLSGLVPVAAGHVLLAVLAAAFLLQHLSSAPFSWWRKRRLLRS
ncbi:MAG TPA: FAD-dependent oxidoreductase [Candidatus Sulfotelmatobacter sp.]|jgi:nitrite reductase (NADH) large subunit|nr:FAD-dependent oxidoreductase [Candidatus Sulfotelmatobacter sp.]